MTVEEALLSSEFDEGQKAVIKWQFQMHGSFYTALFEAIQRADYENLSKLELGFPTEVRGFRQWQEASKDFTAEFNTGSKKEKLYDQTRRKFR